MKTVRLFVVAGAAMLFSGVSSAAELIVNGSFESGLSSWYVTGTPSGGTPFCPTEPRTWNASTTGADTGCLIVSDPVDGTMAAYEMHDGPAGTIYELNQDFIVPAGLTSLSLSWIESTLSSYAGLPRVFSADFYQGATLIGNIYTEAVPFFDADLAWDPHSATGLASLLAPFAGQTVTLRFTDSIPETWTGPAGLGLDSVSLIAVVPEPATLALFGLGLAGIAASRRRRSA